MPVHAAPQSLLDVASRVDKRLESLLAVERKRWAKVDVDLVPPIDEIARLVLAGGKRLRPAFCFWGFVGACGDPADELVIDAGAALELLHAFALFHDDVMDGSLTRRGEPTTNAKFEASHGASKLAGESRRFGDGVAILVGDLAYVYSDQLMRNASPQAWTIWNELRIELNFGQYLDMLGSAMNERRREKAERICRYKSGKYTIERPLHLGALLAAPTRDELIPVLSTYGLPLGDAFQMRDDVLGAFGDTAITGKPVGDDLREGKPTPLMAIATARADAAQLKELQLVGNQDLTPEQIARVQEVIRETGALDELETVITRLTDEAIAAVQHVPFTQSVRDELITLAEYVSWRTV
jgi:geranylgeranyl diphosphate synthase type I